MATLKISDLSVGDWVYYDKGDTPYSIRSIYRTGRQDCVVLNDNKYSEGVIGFVDSLTPIPITAEILEKNGFVKNGEYNEWSTGNWDDIPFIGISLSRQSMRIKNLGTDIFIENKVVYVHQLQRALSLANIDKEITL